jgi:chitin-binding protein
MKNGTYTMSGTLPAGRTGRHLIYTVWQTNPDTYYSCSDVVLTGGGGGGAAANPGDGATPSASAAPDAGTAGGAGAADDPIATGSAEAQAADPGLGPVRNVADTGRMLPFVFGTAALLALAAATLLFVLRRRMAAG